MSDIQWHEIHTDFYDISQLNSETLMSVAEPGDGQTDRQTDTSS
jgi:hypothetical protein